VLVTLLTTAVSSVAQEAAAESGTESAAPSAAGTDVAMQEMMNRMMPGKHHRIFAAMTGNWRGTMRIWSLTRPEAPPVESQTESRRRLVLGNRFVLEEATGSVMRMPMDRMSILGYDNETHRYTLIFYSNMETATNIASGTADQTGKILTLRGESFAEGGKVPFKNIIHLEGDDVHFSSRIASCPTARKSS